MAHLDLDDAFGNVEGDEEVSLGSRRHLVLEDVVGLLGARDAAKQEDGEHEPMDTLRHGRDWNLQSFRLQATKERQAPRLRC